ncbi:MAG: hypothetical protein Q9169_007190 [Polycauliona sp. 2 TL-2023]
MPSDPLSVLEQGHAAVNNVNIPTSPQAERPTVASRLKSLLSPSAAGSALLSGVRNYVGSVKAPWFRKKRNGLQIGIMGITEVPKRKRQLEK